ncbi:transposase, MuDR [Tanacetum coccineum]
MLAATWSLRPDGHTLDSYKSNIHQILPYDHLEGNIHTDLMLYYKIPKLPLHNGLKSLACDKDVMEMCQYVSQCKLMEVFVIHPISEPDLVDNEFDPLFSYPDNNTCKNKPSESNPAKGPSESNPAKRPCESNAGKSFSESNDGKRGSGSSNVKRPSGSNKGKRPIVIEDDDGSDSSEYSGDSEDSDDSDFDIGDEDIIGDVDVDMDDFRKHTDENVEWTECTEKEVQVPPPFDYEEVDLEEFGSGTESDDPECERKRALKKLAKAHRPVDGLVYSDNFYIGQCLANKTLIKEMVSKIAVAQRRQLWLSRNDKTRMTAECRGKVPVFNDGGPVCKESGPLENKPKGDSVKCNKKSKKKGQVGESIKCPCSIGMCTASFLSKEIEEAIKPDPRVPIASLKDQLQRKYELGLSDMKIFRAKQMAEERLFGDWAKQYAQLRQFAIGIERKNSRNKLSRLMWKDELKSVNESLNLSVKELYKARALAEATLRERDEMLFAQCEKIRLLEEQYEKYSALKEIESLKVEIKSLQTENKVLKSGESELSEKIDQMKSQVSELSKKLQISNQEMKQQIILFEEDKRMLAKNEFLEKVSSSVQKEYNDLLASNDVLKQRLETKFKFSKNMLLILRKD